MIHDPDSYDDTTLKDFLRISQKLIIYVAKFKLRLDLINGIRKIESSQNKRDLFRINNGSNSLKFIVVRHSRIHHNPSSLRDKLLIHLVYLYKLSNIADECTETHCH